MAHEPSALDRRLFLAGTGAVFSAPLAMNAVAASAHPMTGATNSLFGKSGNFDLENNRDRLLARIKVNADLSGKRVYLWNMSRHMLCEVGKSPYQIMAELELMTIWLNPPEEGSEIPTLGAYFTRTAVDPLTFDPITSYENPYVGETLPVEDFLFGGSGIPVDANETSRHLVFQQTSPHYRMGDNIVFVNYDPDTTDGPHQPKVDTATYTSGYSDVMDPSTSSADAAYAFSGYFPASSYKWSNVPEGDPTKVLTQKVGRKVSTLNDVPPEFQRTLIAKYPDRI